MDLQTWVSIAVLLGTGATICGFMLKVTTDLGVRINKLDTKTDKRFTNLDTKMEGVRGDLKEEIGKVDSKIDGLDTKFDKKFTSLDTKIDAFRAEATADNSKLEERIYDLAIGLKNRHLIVPPH